MTAFHARDRRTRVLMVIDRLSAGSAGGERAALGLAVHLPRDRYDVWLATTRLAGGQPVADLLASGAHHVHLDRRGRFDLAGHLRLLGLLRRLAPDVVHGHMFGSNVWSALFGRLSRVPVVIAHEQSWSYEGQPLRRAMDGVIGQLCDAFLAVSSADAERMRTLERVPAEKIRLVPNAWAPRTAEVKGSDVRANLGIAADAPVAATVALMRPQKRLDVLLDAFAHTLGRVPDAHLILAGNGPERPAVEERVAALGLETSVHLLGYQQNVDSIWRAADAMVLSSDFEGTPLSVLEAMAAGKPIVSTNVGGMTDIVDAQVAVLVPRRDPVALGDALASVLSDADARKRMGAAAVLRAQDFTAERHADRCAAIYDELLDASRRRR